MIRWNVFFKVEKVEQLALIDPSGLLMRRGWPLALMLCANQVPIESTHSKLRWPKRALLILGTTVSALRRCALANSLWLSACCQQLCRQQLRLLEPLTADHHRPGHPCDLVSKRNGGDLDRPTADEVSEPRPLRAVLAGISDDSHRAGDEQPAQMSIAARQLLKNHILFQIDVVANLKLRKD
jgi:hypothetical protein